MKKELIQYASFARFLKDALGERYRVALVDADTPNSELTVSEQGFSETDTGEFAEAGILSDILAGTEFKKQDYLCCFSDSEKDGEEQKNSIFYIRNEEGGISGFLCIYEKRGDLYMVSEVLDQMLLPDGEAAGSSVRIEAEVNSLLKERIVEVWNRHNPLDEKMKKTEKIAFISELFEMGIFRVRGAVIQVSEVTGFSQASIYRYLVDVVEE